MRQVLIVEDVAGVAAQVAPELQNHANVQVVPNLEAASAALREQTFDLVLLGRSELLPLDRTVRHQRVADVLEGIAQGACIVTRDGTLVRANAAMRAYPDHAIEAVRSAAESLLGVLAEDTSAPLAARVRQKSLNVANEYYFELSVSALPTPDGEVEEVLGLFTDTTAISQMRERLAAIDAAGQELVALNVDATEQLDVSERLALLEDKLIRYCRELLHFTHFAVLVRDPKTEHLDAVLSGGFSEEAKNVDIYAREEGNGISGYVAATGKAYICPDINNDPLYLPGYESAASCLAVPLRLVDRVVGVLNVESDRLAAFTVEDRQVAEIFARYIAVALHTLKLLAVERSETVGQITADVASELARPLDGIIGEASWLLGAPLSSDEAHDRLRAIITRVDRVKELLQTLGRRPGVQGLVPEMTEADPILNGKRVLVADDEEIIRETVADVLQKTGAIAVTAADGAQAIAMIRAQSFDLVLSDIKMPNKNGYDVFAAAKEVRADCPVILITGFGYDPDHIIVRANREGLAAVLFKPFKVDQLLDTMHSALGSGTPNV